MGGRTDEKRKSCRVFSREGKHLTLLLFISCLFGSMRISRFSFSSPPPPPPLFFFFFPFLFASVDGLFVSWLHWQKHLLPKMCAALSCPLKLLCVLIFCLFVCVFVCVCVSVCVSYYNISRVASGTFCSPTVWTFLFHQAYCFHCSVPEPFEVLCTCYTLLTNSSPFGEILFHYVNFFFTTVYSCIVCTSQLVRTSRKQARTILHDQQNECWLGRRGVTFHQT